MFVDLQRVSEIVQSFSGCLEPDAIAKCATEGLIAKFDCAFTRLWLMEADDATLRLVASSGMYTRTDGVFARVRVGAFKVGKIAQNRIPFLSNHLAEESWVKDRDWAIAHGITGFAGYPLVIGDRVVGVLAVFSHYALSSEFLEILQVLCSTLAVTLESSLRLQRLTQSQGATVNAPSAAPLSEQLSTLLPGVRMMLVGTERPLAVSLTSLLLHTVEVLRDMNCSYCRLSYGAEQIVLEAMIFPPVSLRQSGRDWVDAAFGDLLFAATCLGGELKTLNEPSQKLVRLLLQVPYPVCRLGPSVQIQMRSPILNRAFTHLAYQAGLTVSVMGDREDATMPLLTDDAAIATATAQPVLWLAHTTQPAPKAIAAQIDLSITATQLREAIAAVAAGQPWGVAVDPETPGLSEREQEVLSLLAKGLRDRDIASELHISARTVKFHINNILTKLNARTRGHAIHQSIVNGWIRG